jgi:hypothetical protein
MIGDKAQHVGKPSLRIDAVEFRRADQGVDCSRALTATVGAGEQPCAAPESDPAQSALGSVVRQADTAVVENAGEGGPALEHVIHRLGDVGVTRQPGAFGAHPPFERADERPDPFLADREPLLGSDTVDLALDREDLVDAAHCFDRQRRFAEIGQHEEFAPARLQQAASVIGPGRRRAS